MTRVLFIAESFPPVLGGGERHLCDLSRALTRRGLGASVITRRSWAELPQRETMDDTEVVRIAPSGPARVGKYLMLPGVVREILRRRSAYDIVVVRGTRVLGLPGLVAARLARRPIVMQPEVNGELSGEVYSFGRRLGVATTWMVRGATAVRNRWLRDADGFVAMSRAIASEMTEAGVEPRRVHLIPHGVDTERFSPADAGQRLASRQQLQIPETARVVIYTGRLLQGKGLERLVDAFASLLLSRPDVRLLIVGSGAGQAISVETELKRRVSTAGLHDRVNFTGRVEDVRAYLHAADVFAFPSEFEALGLSLLEAGACGLPSVGTRTGGIVDVIDDGATGLLFEAGVPRDLARCLGKLLDAPELRARMGAAARARIVERFDADASVARYQSLFQELTSGPRRSGRLATAASV